MSDDKGFYEIQLDNKWLIMIFIFFVALLGLIFVWGMKVGRDAADLERGITVEETSAKPDKEGIIEEDLTNKSSWGSDKKDDLKTFDLDTDLIKEEKIDAGNSETKKDITPVEDKKIEKPVTEDTSKETRTTQRKPALVKNPTPTNVPNDVPKGFYTIQVTSIKNLERANYFVKVIKEQGYPAFMTTVTLEGEGEFYRVRVGGYETLSEATQVKDRLLNEDKLKSIFKGKKNLLIIKQN